MVLAIRNNLRRGIILLFIWPALSHAGVNATRHDLYPQNREKNCASCHTPHNDKPQPTLWMPGNKPAAGKETVSFVLPRDEEALCLSCHDGVLAKDMCTVLLPDMQIPWESQVVGVGHYKWDDKLFFDTCERHYNLLAYYQNQLPGQKLKCSTCHDVHCLKGSRKDGLISGKVYFKYEICLKCHPMKMR